jgi:hypothetical protein
MRPPVDTIVAPPFPKDLTWLNVAPLRMEKQASRPVLIEFWDFCRPSSLRTLPYVKAWHERYGEAGLRVISVHAPGFAPGRDEDAVREAVTRLGIEHPVVLDSDFLLWRAYDNPGWPGRYLFAPRLRLVDFHHGEGDYHGCELAIRELLEIEGDDDLVPLARAADDEDVEIVIPTANRDGAYSGAYAAGEVWIVSSAAGELVVNGESRALDGAGAHLLIEHERHTESELSLEPRGGLEILATCFAPGLAA